MIGEVNNMNLGYMNNYHNYLVEHGTQQNVEGDREVTYRENTITDADKRTLVDLICRRQTEMISKEHMSFENKEYQNLELLKIKVKALEV